MEAYHSIAALYERLVGYFLNVKHAQGSLTMYRCLPPTIRGIFDK